MPLTYLHAPDPSAIADAAEAAAGAAADGQTGCGLEPLEGCDGGSRRSHHGGGHGIVLSEERRMPATGEAPIAGSLRYI